MKASSWDLKAKKVSLNMAESAPAAVVAEARMLLEDDDMAHPALIAGDRTNLEARTHGHRRQHAAALHRQEYRFIRSEVALDQPPLIGGFFTGWAIVAQVLNPVLVQVDNSPVSVFSGGLLKIPS